MTPVWDDARPGEQVWIEGPDDDPVTRIGLAGEIDLSVSADLDQACVVIAARGRPVLIDVSRVSFMDSVGVGFIARLVIMGHSAGWRPALAGVGRSVLETLRISGVLPAIDLDQPLP